MTEVKRKISEHWITGIFLLGQETEANDGEIAGFDADFGYVYALNGKLVTEDKILEYENICNKKSL